MLGVFRLGTRSVLHNIRTEIVTNEFLPRLLFRNLLLQFLRGFQSFISYFVFISKPNTFTGVETFCITSEPKLAQINSFLGDPPTLFRN